MISGQRYMLFSSYYISMETGWWIDALFLTNNEKKKVNLKCQCDKRNEVLVQSAFEIHRIYESRPELWDLADER